MKRWTYIFFILTSVALAQTAKNRSALYSEIDTQLASNQQIPISVLRAVFKDTVASAYNALNDGTVVITSGAYSDPSWITSLAYSKLTGAPVLATVATTGNYIDLIGKPSFAAVATSGLYSDLVGKPSLATVATSGLYSDLLGKPSLATVATSGLYNDLLGKPTLGTAAAKDIPASGDANAAQVVFGTDSRLTNPRTPTAHASTHTAAGSDPLTLSESQITNLSTDLASKVPVTRTVNGHVLSTDISVTALDVGLGSVTNDIQTKAAIVPNTAPTTGQILVGNAGGTAYAPASVSGDGTLSSSGALTVTKSNGSAFGSNAFTSTAYVPQTTTVNGHALSSNVTVSGADLSMSDVTTANPEDFASLDNITQSLNWSWSDDLIDQVFQLA